MADFSGPEQSIPSLVSKILPQSADLNLSSQNTLISTSVRKSVDFSARSFPLRILIIWVLSLEMSLSGSSPREQSSRPRSLER